MVARFLGSGRWETGHGAPGCGPRFLAPRNNYGSDSRVFGADGVASRASWIWKREIFLACIPGFWNKGGAQKLNEGEAGGWGCQIPDCCREGGGQGSALPGAQCGGGGSAGSFSRVRFGALKRVDRARSKQELKVGMLGLGLGRSGDRDSRVPPCWPGSLTALCTGPRRGLARGCRWAGPGGTAAAQRRRATLGAARAAAAGCLPGRRLRKEALRPSSRVGAERVAKGGVREDAGARSPGLCALRRWEGLGGHLNSVRSAVGEGRSGG